ncbi:MAG: glycosyltransferase family 4 protein, partial [Clostridia bacterium]|nr:glycosyltransferase family 4 protein [Clostridia bacterium]
MKYAFLTTLIPPSMYDEVLLKSKRNMQDAASALQWHIYNGLRTNLKQEIKIFNVLPIGSFPQYYSDLFVRGSDFNDENSERHANIGFCNLKLFRKWHQPKVIYKRLKKWCAEDNEPKTLFVYTVGAQLMAAVSRLKKRYPTLKVCAVVADLPNMSDLSSKRSFLLRCFSGFMSVKAYSQLDTVDAFVLLTEQMADYMKINVPYCVMEGISTKPQREPDFVGADDIKTILYTGTLHKKFGIMNLVDAFSQIENENYRLVICGIGDSEDEIREAASKDSRIEFLG